MPNQTDDKTLPPQLRAIINALGIVRAQEFLKAHGGTTITLPKKHSTTLGVSDDELTALRKELQRHMIDNRVTLPKIDKIITRYRNIEIKQERPYSSLNKLANYYNLTSRQIQNICKEENPTADFFEVFK